MTTLLEALEDVVAAAATVPGMAAATADALGQASLPVILVGAPAPTFTGYCDGPSECTFPVTLLVRLDGDAIRRLLRSVEALATALERDTPAVITGVTPLSYDLGNQVTAAAYEVTVTYPL